MVDWAQAKNLISQQTQILVNEVSRLERDLKASERRVSDLRENLDVVRNDARSLPYGVTRVSLEDKIHVLEGDLRAAEKSRDGYKEFCHLKDNTIKRVEAERDALKARVQEAEREARKWEQDSGVLSARLAVSERAVKNLQDVLKLGRDGLMSERHNIQPTRNVW